MKTAPAVQPNAGVGAWYRAMLQLLVREMAQEFTQLIRTAYTSDAPADGFIGDGWIIVDRPAHETYEVGEDGFAIDSTRVLHPARTFLQEADPTLAQDAKPKQPQLNTVMDKWAAVWRKKMETLSIRTAWNFAAKNREATDAGVKASFKTAGLIVKFKPTKGMKAAFEQVVGYNVGLVKSIPEEYLSDVQSVVWQNVLKGGDLKTLGDELQKKYEIAHHRAAFIASDQNAKAKAVFENQRRKELGITKAVWQHSSAGIEPRPVHVAWGKEQKVYLIEEGLYDPDAGEQCWPGTLIKCRCTSRAVIPGFE